MTPLQFKFVSTLRIVSLTLSVTALIILLAEGYIQSDFDTIRVILLAILAWNIIYFYLSKPQQPIP